MLHHGRIFHAGEEGKEEEKEFEHEEEDDAIMDDEGDRPDTNVELKRHTQHFGAPQHMKAMPTGTSQSKLILALTMHNTKDIYVQNATIAFRDMKRGKGKKMHSNYAPKETIITSKEDKDDCEMVKHLRSDPTSPTTFAHSVLMMEEANQQRARQGEHHC